MTASPSDEPTVLIINGPNLNMLGVREPSVYGPDTLGDIEAACAERAGLLDLAVDFRQTNVEGEIVSWIQEARGGHDGIIINAKKLTMQRLVQGEGPALAIGKPGYQSFNRLWLIPGRLKV